MPRIESLRLFATELPFRNSFRRAAAGRSTSSSLVLECRLSNIETFLEGRGAAIDGALAR